MICTTGYGYGKNLVPTGFMHAYLPSTTANINDILFSFVSDVEPVIQNVYDDGAGVITIEGYNFNSDDISEYSVKFSSSYECDVLTISSTVVTCLL